MAAVLDFYKKFRLPQPVCGLVNKVTSPKGIRKQEEGGFYSYHLHTDLVCIYKGEATRLDPGIYWVLDVCKPDDCMEWYQYLFVVEDDDAVYPVAEYLRQTGSEWILDAQPIIKKYFKGEQLTPIQLTRIRQVIPKKTRWDQVSH